MHRIEPDRLQGQGRIAPAGGVSQTGHAARCAASLSRADTSFDEVIPIDRHDRARTAVTAHTGDLIEPRNCNGGKAMLNDRPTSFDGQTGCRCGAALHAAACDTVTGKKIGLII